MDTETQSAVASFLRKRQRRDSLPGVAVAVAGAAADEPTWTDESVEATGASSEWAAGFGARDLAGNRSVGPDTLFPVGGATQPLTAAAVRQLATAGLCSLDDPVADHLDVALPRGPDGEPIRLRHLLEHSSGLPALGLRETLLARGLRIGTDTLPLADWDDVRAHLAAADETLAPPGETVSRCPAGYVLLGRVVQSCTGRPYAEYVTEHLLEPLGADRATFDDTAFAMDDDHATQYLLEDGEPCAASLPADERLRPATGLLASARHLAAVARLGLGDGTVDGRDVVAGGLGTTRASEGDAPPGWESREVCGRRVIERAGHVAVGGGYVGYAPDADRGVALAANAVPDYPVAALGAGVFGCLFDADPVAAAPALARRRRLATVTGRYESTRGVRTAHLTREEDTLLLRIEGPLQATTRPLVPVGPGDDTADGRGDTADGHGDDRQLFLLQHDDGAARRVTVDTTAQPTTLTVGRWRYRRIE
jgi:CubicO group peptidase (beta-lactamase class C family)